MPNISMQAFLDGSDEMAFKATELTYWINCGDIMLKMDKDACRNLANACIAQLIYMGQKTEGLKCPE